MKLNGPNGNFPNPNWPQESLTPKQLETAKSELDALVDGAKLMPLANSFELLAQHDRSASLLEAARIPSNLKTGFEALVGLKSDDGNTYVLPVRKEEEVPLYAALVSGGAVEDEIGAIHIGLRQADKAGHRFYLARGDQHLRTDAAGAAISLDRGSRLVLQRSDGQYETHNTAQSAFEFLSNTDEKVAESRRNLQQAKRAGISYSPHNPLPREEEEPKSLAGRILSNFGQDDSELALERSLAESLAQTGKLNVGFADDTRPLALPLALGEEEIKIASNWERSTLPPVKLFKQDFKSQIEQDTIFMTQQSHGDMKGMVVRADDRAAYFQLNQGNRVVALDKDGDLHELKSFEDFRRFTKTGRANERKNEFFDGDKVDSDNLMMMYHVSPFDPIGKGNYDDLPQRITQIGSSEQLDIVTMRSDLPTKRNLRVDRAQKGELENLKTLDPALAMNDPKVLENFIYETVSSNLGDDKIRFLVGGHGGAEKGLLPDGEHNNAEANHAMSVDNFAGAISKALDRVEQETGKRPKIDNLMLVSCLMGNTSFIHALAQTGDIDTLIASPELMSGSNPISTFAFLNDPKTSKADGREYAEHLLNEWSVAPSSVGGNKDEHHASTIGAYDLSPQKAARFQKALGGFFEAALAEPQYAEYLKESIAKAPSYGINPLVNVMFDVDNRDLLQVLDHAATDARITSPKLKKAMTELQEVAEGQVLDQRVTEDYKGRRGPSLYLPLDEWDFNSEMGETQLLKSMKYKEFMDLIFEAPLQRSVAANLVNEVSRLSETGSLDKAFKKVQQAAKDSLKPKMPEQDGYIGSDLPETLLERPDDSEDVKATKADLREYVQNVTGPEAAELADLSELEERTEVSVGSRAVGLLRGATTAALGIAGGLITGAIAAVPALVVGGLAGARAGWTGTSFAGTHKPASKAEMEVLTNVVDEFMEANPEMFELEQPDHAQDTADSATKTAPGPSAPLDPDLSPLEGLREGRVAKGLTQLLLLPSEKVGIKTHEKVGRAYGELPGKLAGAVTGLFSGAVLNTLAAGSAGFVVGGLFTGAKVKDTLDKITPTGPQKAEAIHLGRFQPKESTES